MTDEQKQLLKDFLTEKYNGEKFDEWLLDWSLKSRVERFTEFKKWLTDRQNIAARKLENIDLDRNNKATALANEIDTINSINSL